jgi:HK97 family phage major capsid protein
MSTYLEQLAQRKGEAVHRMREILDGAAAESREVTTEEDASLTQIDSDLSRFDAEIERFTSMQEKADSDNELRAAIEPLLAVASRVDHPTNNDDQRFRDAWSQIRKGASGAVFESDLSPEFYQELRGLTTPGGTAIATTFIDQVTVYERTATPMLDPDVVRIIPTTSGEPLTFPRLTADPAFGGTLTAEAGAITELDPTLSSVTLNAYKYAGITLWSAELDQDNVIGLDDLIADAAGRQLGLNIGTALTTGDGSDKPNGFITAAANGGTASQKLSGGTANTFFGPDDLIDLMFSLASPYRTQGVWQMSNTAIKKVRKFKDNENQYIWEFGGVGAPDRVLGEPVYENPAMAAVASASKSVAFGDFKRYFVRRVLPVRVEVSKDYKFNTDQIAVKVVERVDGDLIDTNAIAYLVSDNT